MRRLDADTMALGAVLVVTTILRFGVPANGPLWIDETQAGMIASQRSLAEFAKLCYLDVNAPLYYIIATLFAHVTGLSNFALRFPVRLFGSLAPLIALASRKDLDRPVRYVWSALAACWISGLLMSQQARCYPLVYCLGMANAVAFLALLRSPTMKSAWIWASLTSLFILSHYYALVLAGVQGVVFLAVYRWRAMSTWPAAIAFAPALAMIAIEATRLIGFTSTAHAWKPVLTHADVLSQFSFVAGSSLLQPFIAIWSIGGLAATLMASRRSDRPRDAAGPQTAWPKAAWPKAAWTVAGCSFGAMLAALAFGLWRSILVDRYLTAFVPGILLGLALLAQAFARHWKTAPQVLIAGFLALFLAVSALVGKDSHNWTFETASEALMASHPSRLVFLWDGPMQPDATTLRGLGGFFFARAGRPVSVEPVSISRGDDPNVVLPGRASQPGTAILWLYDSGIEGTAAIRHPPSIDRIDPRWHCANYGWRQFGAIGCARGT